MNPVDAGNPYQPPEASIAPLRAEIEVRTPLVFAVISVFCWISGVYSGLFSTAILIVMGSASVENGWRRVFFTRDGPRNMLLIVLGVLATITYITAARSLRARRRTPGLTLCSLGVGLTYLGIWLLTRK
jgi:hypothetical protein